MRSRWSCSAGIPGKRSFVAPTCSRSPGTGRRRRRMSLQLWDEDAAALQRRLELLGLPADRSLVLHENRTVMVSQARAGAIRMHRGYIYAPDRVLRAIVTFLHPRTRRPLVRRAQRELLTFPVEEFIPLRRS